MTYLHNISNINRLKIITQNPGILPDLFVNKSNASNFHNLPPSYKLFFPLFYVFEKIDPGWRRCEDVSGYNLDDDDD